MGKVLSSIKHPFRNFNLESRAHKVISQPKPKAAPRHAKDEIDLQRIRQDYPEVFEESLKKNEQLDRHLKDVYVVANDAPPDIKTKANPDRPLPQVRTQPALYSFGIKEPNKIPLGKTTLRLALQFISQHQNDPKKHSAENIALEHKLPEETVKNILKYFRVFEVYIPVETVVKTKFAGPSVPRQPKVYVIKNITKELPAPAKDDTKKDGT